jgi:hypothetical protein
MPVYHVVVFDMLGSAIADIGPVSLFPGENTLPFPQTLTTGYYFAKINGTAVRILKAL